MKEKPRCFWVQGKSPIYIHYHDEEWGTPCHDDKLLYEFLILECFQAGLSWECILNKRPAFAKAFSGFDAQKVAKFNDKKITALMQDEGIIRNRRKIEASIHNSCIFLEIQKEFGSFDNYIWGFTRRKTIPESCDLRTTSPLSDEISNDLRKRGMRFVGSTTIYAYLQSIGIINGHTAECFRHPQ